MTNKRFLSLIICTIFFLSLLAGPALAKGAKGFSGGGKKSFSSGAKGYSTGGSYSSKPGNSSDSSSFSGSPQSSPAPSGSSVGGGTGSFGKGYSTDTGSFSTPRQNSPPTLHNDFSTGQQGYSSGKGSYSTGTGSYVGSWNRETFAGMDKYPAKAPVGVFGSVPKPPYYYHNTYWGMPLLARMFFQPNYYWLPWGYHFFAPRLITWVIAIILIGAAVILIRNRIRRSVY